MFIFDLSLIKKFKFMFFELIHLVQTIEFVLLHVPGLVFAFHNVQYTALTARFLYGAGWLFHGLERVPCCLACLIFEIGGRVRNWLRWRHAFTRCRCGLTSLRPWAFIFRAPGPFQYSPEADHFWRIACHAPVFAHFRLRAPSPRTSASPIPAVASEHWTLFTSHWSVRSWTAYPVLAESTFFGDLLYCSRCSIVDGLDWRFPLRSCRGLLGSHALLCGQAPAGGSGGRYASRESWSRICSSVPSIGAPWSWTGSRPYSFPCPSLSGIAWCGRLTIAWWSLDASRFRPGNLYNSTKCLVSPFQVHGHFAVRASLGLVIVDFVSSGIHLLKLIWWILHSQTYFLESGFEYPR